MSISGQEKELTVLSGMTPFKSRNRHIYNATQVALLRFRINEISSVVAKKRKVCFVID